VPVPLSVEEVVIWACGYPSCEEVIVVVILALCLASCVEVVDVGERRCVLLSLDCQILGGASLYGRSYVDI